MKLRLTVEVDYKANEAEFEDLACVLMDAVEHLAANGMFSVDAGAEVNQWSADVEEVGRSTCTTKRNYQKESGEDHGQ